MSKVGGDAYGFLNGEHPLLVVCSAGKFSAAMDSWEVWTCRDCARGKYSTALGAVSADVCQDCSAGKYSNSSGATSSSDCLPCPSGSNSAAGSSVCICNVGYTGPVGQSCSACAKGTYKNQMGSAACVNCSAGTYLNATGATSASDCLPCPSGSNSQAGAAVCTCNEGYLGPGRCGPLAGYSRCGGGGSTPEPDHAIYCNEENGWCGNTLAHRDAQPGNSYDFLANSGGCSEV